jgi:hypothetical protein
LGGFDRYCTTKLEFICNLLVTDTVKYQKK